MKVRIDPGSCQGHGRCYSLAPDVFEPDDEGHGLVIVEDVPAARERDAHAGVANCPERAISVSES